MQYGICHLSNIPVRLAADDASELVTQLLYGEHFKVIEQRKLWSKVRSAFDKSEGWAHNNQLTLISEEEYNSIENSKAPKFAQDLVSFVESEKNNLLPVVLGSVIHEHFGHKHEGSLITDIQPKNHLINTALTYLNTPFLWGGKTPFGIDGAGFTQMVYKLNGYRLLRTAETQATQGEALSFIEECEPGDLAFFDNNEGIINHVGIIMENNYIIHVYGKVRIDRIDHTGIFNTETKTYTHKLRVIKQIV